MLCFWGIEIKILGNISVFMFVWKSNSPRGYYVVERLQRFSMPKFSDLVHNLFKLFYDNRNMFSRQRLW